MDYDSVAKVGSMLGSGGTVVIDEDTCMVDVARRIMHFYAHESCGWCIPCREGTAWLRKMLDRFHEGGGRAEDIPLIGELSKNMLGRTFCPLGDAAAMPTISIVKKWRNEFEDHLHGKVRVQDRREAIAGECVRTTHGGTKTSHVHDRRPAGDDAGRHAGDRSGQAPGHRSSLVLLLPWTVAAGRLPHVPGRSGEDAEAADGVHARWHDGMVVSTDTPQVHKARKDMLEFLLSNHPLDCPVCDKGGECELQDMTFRYGAGPEPFHRRKAALSRRSSGRRWFITMRRAASCASAACASATKAWT